LSPEWETWHDACSASKMMAQQTKATTWMTIDERTETTKSGHELMPLRERGDYLAAGLQKEYA
jgi:hypothetical protein